MIDTWLNYLQTADEYVFASLPAVKTVQLLQKFNGVTDWMFEGAKGYAQSKKSLPTTITTHTPPPPLTHTTATHIPPPPHKHTHTLACV